MPKSRNPVSEPVAAGKPVPAYQAVIRAPGKFSNAAIVGAWKCERETSARLSGQLAEVIAERDRLRDALDTIGNMDTISDSLRKFCLDALDDSDKIDPRAPDGFALPGTNG